VDQIDDDRVHSHAESAAPRSGVKSASFGDWSLTDSGHEHFRAEVDGRQYIRLARTLDVDADLREATFATPRSKDRLNSRDSQMLFVAPDAPLGRNSPGSFVTASLTQSVRQMDTAATLTYFCRRELPSGVGPTASMTGLEPVASMTASLVAQLLMNLDFDLTAWSSTQTRQDHEDVLRSKRLDFLFSLLKLLVVLGYIWHSLLTDRRLLPTSSDRRAKRRSTHPSACCPNWLNYVPSPAGSS